MSDKNTSSHVGSFRPESATTVVTEEQRAALRKLGALSKERLTQRPAAPIPASTAHLAPAAFQKADPCLFGDSGDSGGDSVITDIVILDWQPIDGDTSTDTPPEIIDTGDTSTNATIVDWAPIDGQSTGQTGDSSWGPS